MEKYDVLFVSPTQHTDTTLHQLYSEVFKYCGTQLSQSQGGAAFYTFKNIQLPPSWAEICNCGEAEEAGEG